MSPFSDENFLFEARRYKLNPTSFSWHSTAMDTQQSQTGKNFKTDSKRAAVELWRTGDSVSLDEEAAVRSQLHQHGPVEGGHPPGPGLAPEDSGNGFPA
jgi:hypothetical protein